MYEIMLPVTCQYFNSGIINKSTAFEPKCWEYL
jgi:hypothetical protein